ncbi:PilL N-terminal domain-containing protein [Pseudomonas aeruginosa]|uniref:PFGI-1 class ICE element type IV pilus protein PilL2 n=1 Tax=Pseudomonas aeruginosa TaxID=287 RepID=UPI000F7DD6A0|nr:PilL N-terminal domain-containing protein [Pseudomonas aeruginosa]RTB44119.1 integrating conjugative element protein pill, pfgi-1 [Pseudomonas aeruginosa]
MPFHRLRPACALSLLAILLASGCATVAIPPISDLPEAEEAPADEALLLPEPDFIPVVRYGRYTLVELAPTAAQHDLLLQTVDVVMPDQAQASVADGLRHVLLRTGYRLCDADTTRALGVLPLPAAHLHLGPLMLRDALLALAGPAWQMRVDETERLICFAPAGVPVERPGIESVDVGHASEPDGSVSAIAHPVTDLGEQP